MSDTILKIDNLVTEFSVQGRHVPAVRGVSLEVKRGTEVYINGSHYASCHLLFEEQFTLKEGTS